MMGIFQKKSSDFGSLFTRNKKEKMTSKENEDEESLMSLSKSKQSRKPNRKNKHKTSLKFRRLQDEFAEPGTPEYEPPKGDLFAEADGPKVALFSTNDSKPAVPTNIQVSASTDTMSTLEGSLADIVLKQHRDNRNPDVREKRKPDEEPLVPSKHATSGWVLNFEDRSFKSIPSEQPEPQQSIDPSKKSKKKEKKMVQPKFYPLDDAPSNEGSSKFENPKFNDPFTTSEQPKIQFACSEEYENDENVEKVSESGSDDFHQFVIRKMPSQRTVSADQSTSKRDASLVKAAKTIAISLSSPSPKKKSQRMVPSGSAKRARHVLGETKPLRNRTLSDSKHRIKTVTSEPKRMDRYSNPPQVSCSGTNPWSIIGSDSSISHTSTENSLLLGKKNMKKNMKAGIETVESEEMGLFDIGTFSQLDDQLWPSVAASPKVAKLQTSSDVHPSVDSRGDDLINIIRSSSTMRSQSEAAKKPDPPSPTHSGHDKLANNESNFPTTEKLVSNNFTLHGAEALTAESTSSPNYNNFLELTQSKSSSDPTMTSNPSGIPSNAILASMLFRRAHSESTMVLPGEKGRAPDPFDDETQEIPLQVELDFMDEQAVSSVTEDAGSFYHENFEKWNNRANQALNSFYKTASSNMNAYKLSTFQEVQENTLYDA